MLRNSDNIRYPYHTNHRPRQQLGSPFGPPSRIHSRKSQVASRNSQFKRTPRRRLSILHSPAKLVIRLVSPDSTRRCRHTLASESTTTPASAPIHILSNSIGNTGTLAVVRLLFCLFLEPVILGCCLSGFWKTVTPVKQHHFHLHLISPIPNPTHSRHQQQPSQWFTTSLLCATWAAAPTIPPVFLSRHLKSLFRSLDKCGLHSYARDRNSVA